MSQDSAIATVDSSVEIGSLRVLIVEDDDDARASLQDILEMYAHRVATAASAEEALLLPLDRYDVILLDRKLPDGMVEKFLPEVRSRAPEADLIVITGYADLDASIAAMRQGATDFLLKPINPDALLSTLQRIADRRRVERELTAERQFGEMVLQTAEAVILVLDTHGRIQRFNRYLADLTGFTLAEVVQQDWFTMFIPELHRDSVREIFEHTINDFETRGVLNPIITKDGQHREVRWSNAVLRGSDGVATGVVSIGLDVTDLVAAQRKLVQSERLAAIGQTMTGLAHESRNALQRLQNAVVLLEDDLADNHEALVYVKKIARAGSDLHALLEEVRSYAAPIKLELESVSLQYIWRRAWQSLETSHVDHRGTLLESSPENRDPRIDVDSRRMEQVFRNLFENAFDACGPNVEVAIQYQWEGNMLSVTLGDNGPGLPTSDRGRIFDAFFTTKATGTGLGLAIVQRIIESHQGTIELVPTSRGTTFRICLPAHGDETP